MWRETDGENMPENKIDLYKTNICNKLSYSRFICVYALLFCVVNAVVKSMKGLGSYIASEAVIVELEGLSLFEDSGAEVHTCTHSHIEYAYRQRHAQNTIQN